jgi:sugar diacid utilization regulator/putative methionine-R-sulfoxide reductase with GAF domain
MITEAAKSAGVATNRGVSLTTVSEAQARIARASERGFAALLGETAEAFLRVTGGSRARVLLNCGGAWRRYADARDLADREAFDLGTETTSARVPTFVAEGLFVPVRADALAVVVTGAQRGRDAICAAACLGTAFDLALRALESRPTVFDDESELDVMQRVSLRILKSHDLPEILLLITHETRRLLGADICGIMLREGDSIAMQRCVGNFSAQTESLRMAHGQGVAGRVLAMKVPVCVENYVESDVISGDFMSLARVEKVRSALAAPILSEEDVIGVLEVWRRQTASFDDRDVQRIVALANLTSLAIENARLSQSRLATVEELARANVALTEQLDVIRSSSAFQNELIRLQLDGKTLAHVAAKAAEHLGADVFILDAQLGIEGAFPARDDLPASVRAAVAQATRRMDATRGETTPLEGRTLLVRSATDGTETLGFVAVLCDAPSQRTEFALAQICTATSLHMIGRRAAGRAQAETLGAVLWDLLEGSEEVRTFALARARDLHVDLSGRSRVYLCRLEGIEKRALADGWTAKDLSARRRAMVQAHRSVTSLSPLVRLAGMRGNTIALVCSVHAAQDAAEIGNAWARAVAERMPDLVVHVGISSVCHDSKELHGSLREARISVEVARQRGPVAAATFEDGGIVGLLLSLRDEADVRKLVRTIFGSLMDEKPEAQSRLLGTLATFFEVNCSRTATAERLGVHEKTIAYRLSKIRDLTGLDFNLHEKRLLADIALRMHGLSTVLPLWKEHEPAPL